MKKTTYILIGVFASIYLIAVIATIVICKMSFVLR